MISATEAREKMEISEYDKKFMQQVEEVIKKAISLGKNSTDYSDGPCIIHGRPDDMRGFVDKMNKLGYSVHDINFRGFNWITLEW